MWVEQPVSEKDSCIITVHTFMERKWTSRLVSPGLLERSVLSLTSIDLTCYFVAPVRGDPSQS